MQERHKPRSTAANMLYLVRCTGKFLPSLLVWTATAAAVQTAIPVLEMILPKIILSELSSGGTWQRLAAVTAGVSLSLILLIALEKLCERCVYDRKLQMGSFHLHRIANKTLETDYENRESERFRTLQQECCRMCQGNESELRNVYYSWIGLLSGIAGFFAYSAVLAQLHPVLLVFLILTALAGSFTGRAPVKWLDAHSAERARYNRQLGYVDLAAEDPRAAKDILLYRMGALLRKRYGENMEKIAGWYRRYGRVVLRSSIADSSLSLLREGVAYAYLIVLALRGAIGAGDFVLYFAAISGFSAWMRAIVTHLTALRRTSLMTDKYRAFLDIPERFRRAGGISTAEMQSCPRTFQLTDVRYRYAGAPSDAAAGISLRIGAGEHIGIVGLNGAGKTTLVKLLCGLIDPTEGEIRYGNAAVAAYNRLEYYALFSAVFQQYSLLPIPLCEIVAASEQYDLQKVRLCLERAGLWEKAASLPDGVHTLYDRTIHENGVAFSGGEVQKLLLARALYRDAPVLLLDEPTAALDPISERELYESYHAITHGKTAVFISHRLASTRFCDRILLIEDGRIAEEGSHEELMRLGGRYAALYETQAAYYREGGKEEKP